MKSDIETETANQVENVNVRLPPFWPNSPSTWFIQVEAQFALSRIKSDICKYNHIISSLPQDVAESIADILENPPKNDLYIYLKNNLISRHSLSIEGRIKKLISGEQMCDRKPSEFYRALKQLAGTSGTVGEDLILKLWLTRLPNLINIALIPHKTEDVSKVLNVADQIWEAMQENNISLVSANQASSSSRVTQPVPSDNISEKINSLQNEIQEIKGIVASMSISRTSRPRSRSRTPSRYNQSRSNSRKRFNPKGPQCWYHFKFGSKAQKCVEPCTSKHLFTQSMSSN